MQKKSKNGVTEQDIIPLLKRVELEQAEENTLTLLARVRCQNPALNPMQLLAAVDRYQPELSPDFCCCRRVEVYDENGNVFR